jgi:hypothetical protein
LTIQVFIDCICTNMQTSMLMKNVTKIMKIGRRWP